MMSWQVNKRFVKERLAYLYKNSILSDCKFVIGSNETNTKEFSVHTLILAMSSSKFLTMLNNTESPIRITNVHPDIFDLILQYLYTDEMSLSSVYKAFEVYKAAFEFDLPFLSKYCMDFIIENVDCSNAISVYEYAKSCSCSNIMEKSMSIISKRTSDILSNVELLTAQYQTLLDILDQDKLNVPSELDLFNVFQTWVLTTFKKTENTVDIEKLRAFATPGLQKIRFLSMNVTDFLKGPMKSEFLSREDLCNILANIPSSQPKFPIPVGFSNDRCPRIQLAVKKLNMNCDLYLPRVIKNPVVRFNSDQFTDVIRFTTDDDVKLIGIQMPSQIIDSNTVAIHEYNEYILVSVTNLSDTKNMKKDSESLFHTVAPTKASTSGNDTYSDLKSPFPGFTIPPHEKSSSNTPHGSSFPMFPPFGNINHNFMVNFGQTPETQPVTPIMPHIKEANTDSEEKSLHDHLNATEYAPKVNFNSMMLIKLNKPICISKNDTYELKITLNKKGYYQIGYLDQTNSLVADDVQFKFTGYADIAFVTCVIFNH